MWKPLHLVPAALILVPQLALAEICGPTDTRTQTIGYGGLGRIRDRQQSDGVCSAWRALNGSWVTAGHCVNNGGIANLEYARVPNSTAAGIPVPPAPGSMFPIDQSSIVFRDSTDDPNANNDWAIFKILPNPAGGLPMDGVFIRLSRTAPAVNTIASVMGYGINVGNPTW